MRPFRLLSVFFPVGVAALIGCGGDSKPGAEVAPTAAPKAAEKPHADHAQVGPHGGLLAEWGDHEYHVEVTVDHSSSTATVYLLDGDAKAGRPVDAATLTLLLSRTPPVTVALAAKPEAGDPAGRSSRFVGTHPALATELATGGSVAGKVGGKPYSGDFKNGPHATHTPDAGAVTQRETDLFLKPGGIYTAADIAKNGNVVPSVKFKGMSWSHDDELKPGDKLCPVTVNKADAQCKWWANGQEYEFCCPPCLEKFVKWAKESPEKVKVPAEYIKK